MLINLSSSQFSNFLICPSDLSRFSSVFTDSSKRRGTRLPFSCTGFRGSWKSVIFVWFLFFQSEGTIAWKFSDIIPISFSNEEYRLMDLQILLYMWSGKCFWDTSIPIVSKLTFPRLFLSCLSVRKKWLSLWDQPFENIGQISFPVMLIALSPNFYSCRTSSLRKLTEVVESTWILRTTCFLFLVRHFEFFKSFSFFIVDSCQI